MGTYKPVNRCGLGRASFFDSDVRGLTGLIPGPFMTLAWSPPNVIIKQAYIKLMGTYIIVIIKQAYISPQVAK